MDETTTLDLPALQREVAELRRIRALLLSALALATGTTEDVVREGPTGCAAETAAELARLRRRDAIVQRYIDELGDVDTTDDGRLRANHWTALEGELGERSQHEVVRAKELARLRRVEEAAKARLREGCSATCNSALGAYRCDCGHETLSDALTTAEE